MEEGDHDGFKKQLQELLFEKKLTALPPDDGIEKVMTDEFSRVATAWADSGLDAELTALETSLKGQRTRLVPIPTDALQGIIPIAQAKTYTVGDETLPQNLANWTKLIKQHVDSENDGRVTPMQNLKGVTSTPVTTVQNLIVSPGAYNALVRGDVPYYMRDLGSSDVFDEEDNKIAVPGLKKVGKDIAQEMKDRRKGSPAQALKVFKAQGVAEIVRMNQGLRVWLGAP